MSLLTDKDQMAWHGPLRKMLQHHGITKHSDTVIEADILETVKPLIEAAVLQKLATVSVEPCVGSRNRAARRNQSKVGQH